MLPSRLVKRQHATHVVEVHHRAPRARRDASKEQSVRRRSEASAAQASPTDEVSEDGAHDHGASKLQPVHPCVAHVCVRGAVGHEHLVGVGESGLRRREDPARAVRVRPEQTGAHRGVGRAGRAARMAAGLVPAPAAAVQHDDPVSRAVAWRREEVVPSVGAVVAARVGVGSEGCELHGLSRCH